MKFIGDISRKVLTENLRRLENDGVINRTAYADTPPRAGYSLTETGRAVKPIFNAMAQCGAEYQNKNG